MGSRVLFIMLLCIRDAPMSVFPPNTPVHRLQRSLDHIYTCHVMPPGISPAGAPFSPPVAFKHTLRPGAGKHEKTRILQGRCHSCEKWINVEGVKDVEVKVCFRSSYSGLLWGEGAVYDAYADCAMWCRVGSRDILVEARCSMPRGKYYSW